MDRSEYMRIKGALSNATERTHAVSAKASSKKGELQGCTNKMLNGKLTEATARQAHALIDELLALQQQEAYWQAQVATFTGQLDGVDPPAD